MIGSFLQKINSSLRASSAAPGDEPAVLCSPVWSNGGFQFQTYLAKRVEYKVEFSGDLKNWTIAGSKTGKGEINYLDASAPKTKYRFYRLWADGALCSNIIGYATITLPPGFSMVANPLVSEDSRVATLFRGMPEGTAVNKFDAGTHKLVENFFEAGKWTFPDEKLTPGGGAVFFNPSVSPKSVRFLGAILDQNSAPSIPAGISISSSIVPLPGRLDTDLGFPLDPGDVVQLYDKQLQDYVPYPVDENWETKPAMVEVGEAFWITKQPSVTRAALEA